MLVRTLESKPQFLDFIILQSLEHGKPGNHVLVQFCRCVYNVSSNEFRISTNKYLEQSMCFPIPSHYTESSVALFSDIRTVITLVLLITQTIWIGLTMAYCLYTNFKSNGQWLSVMLLSATDAEE
jgi:hypothetical protein